VCKDRALALRERRDARRIALRDAHVIRVRLRAPRPATARRSAPPGPCRDRRTALDDTVTKIVQGWPKLRDLAQNFD
jgi:hypothetical protein